MSLLSRVRGFARVEMSKSVVGPVAGRFVDLQAGQVYWLRPDVVDELVLKGYGEGAISRGYSDRHIAQLLEGHQTVDVANGQARPYLGGGR